MRDKSRRLILALALTIGGVFGAYGEGASGGSIAVSHVWARATPGGGKTGVVYLTIVNGGTGEDQLSGASTPIAESAQVHSSMADGAVMKVAEIATLAVPAGGTVELKPSALHLMLVNLKQPLVEGTTLPLELTFARAGRIGVSVLVGKVGAMADPGAN